MGQPIRKNIQEVHNTLIKDEPIYTLLVDGNSLLFHCFKDEHVNSDGIHYGGIFQFLLQLKMLFQKKSYDYVYVFFDNEYSGWLRWNLYKPYKANRDKNYQDYGVSDYMKQYNANLRSMQHYIFNKNKKKQEEKGKSTFEEFIDKNFDRERDCLCRYFNKMYIRWYIDEVVEGDDLIAYYCINKKPNEKIVIVTGDMDISQVLQDDICVYNLNLKKYITNKNYKEYFGMPCENILIKKILCGDTSDNISNIAGLSENKFFEIMPEAKERPITITEFKTRTKELIEERLSNKKKPLKVYENVINGVSNKEYDGDFYEINEKIIDLRHPLLTDEAKEEMDNMMYAVQDTDRSYGELYSLLKEDKIEELLGETKFATFFSTFKSLEEKEIKRYKEFLKQN